MKVRFIREDKTFIRFTGWCAYIAAGATIFGFNTFVIFFTDRFDRSTWSNDLVDPYRYAE